jgi:chromosome partitioning protein
LRAGKRVYRQACKHSSKQSGKKANMVSRFLTCLPGFCLQSQPANVSADVHDDLLARNTYCQHRIVRATVDRMNIVVANTKGGVGKSTIAVHLAVWLHDQGARVALLDLDKQRSSSPWIAEAEPKVTVRTAGTPDECLSELRALAESHDFVVGDGPGGLDDVSRTLLLLADLAILPITPSILDLRSVREATSILNFAQGINGGRPEGRLVLNKIRTRDTISRELRLAAPGFGVAVAEHALRDLQAYRDAPGQGTVVTRMLRKAKNAAEETERLFLELIPDIVVHKSLHASEREIING